MPTPDLAAWAESGVRGRLTQILLLGAVLFSAVLIQGRSVPPALEMRNQTIGAIIGDWAFNIIEWELTAISEKLGSLADTPSAELSTEQEVALVEEYLAGAGELGRLEVEINRLLSLDDPEIYPEIYDELARLRADLADLRSVQLQRRPLVEAIIQEQVAQELALAGLGVGGRPFPPVIFTFVEPPKKLVVSPRDRIATVYAQMLTEEIDPAAADRSEAAIREATNLSAFITDIGGLGAYPSMVVDRAGLSWIFSTVAHEWIHNYLTLFPLGLRYNLSSDLITLNETVAEIVGDEIGERVVRRYYPDALPADPLLAPTAADGGEVVPQVYLPLPFDFQREMRETRLRVDGLLAVGLVETAERYMEARRQYFVANGYALRVLNQAYFAFHGSYGTSAASTSPIGPKLQALRERTEDLSTFLRTVRWFTNSDDLDRALLEWGRAS